MTQPAKHTPGPWVVHTFTISGKEKLEVLDATGTNACVQANAHLIAAAPAMYEGLKYLIHLVGEENVPGDILATIAQAEGRHS